MKTSASFLVAALTILFFGCSSPAPKLSRTIGINVIPTGALLEISVHGGGILFTGHAPWGHLDLTLTGPASFINDGTLLVRASSPNCDDASIYLHLGESGPFTIELHKNYESQQKDIQETQVKNRKTFVEQHPALSPEISAAIQEGKLVAGMDWQQAKAALGELYFEMKSETATGTVELWNAQDQYYRYSLYFAGGWLVRWTTVPLYR